MQGILWCHFMLKMILFALRLSRLGVDKHFAEIFLTFRIPLSPLSEKMYFMHFHGILPAFFKNIKN